jgi:hypothetical protein
MRVFMILNLVFILFFGITSNVKSQNFWQHTNGTFVVPIHVLAMNSRDFIFAGLGDGIFSSIQSTTDDPAVTLLSPNGGENWHEDMYHDINWVTNIIYNITRIQLFYSTDNGANYVTIIDSTENEGVFRWTVPRTPSTQALVKILAYDSGVLAGEDISDQNFIIQDIDTYIHRTGNMAHTIRNDGISGSAGGTFYPAEPSLEFLENSGHHHLYLHNLLLGTINMSGDTLATLPWGSEDFHPVSKINVHVRAGYTESVSICEDNIGLGTKVETRTFSFPGNSFIIFFHRIYNTSSVDYPEVYVGSFADFDINGCSQNLSGYDPANRLGYMYDATGGWGSYAGICFMDVNPLTFRRAGIITGHINYSPGGVYRALMTPGFDNTSSDPPEDYRVLESIGPFSLNQNDTIIFSYALISENGLGNLISASQEAQSIWSGPSINSSSISDITQVSALLNASINPNYLETNVFFEYGQTSSYGQKIPAVNNPISGNSPVTVSVRPTNLSPGENYNWRVVAVNPAKIIFGNDQTFNTLEYPKTLNISHTFSYPEYNNVDQYKSQDYRIIGFPGNYNNSISNLLPGDQGTEWQVYWDNGSNSADPNVYLDKYDGGSKFLCSVGRAFWLINKGDWEVNELTANTANLNINGEVEIPLHSGWNIITNPFAEAVPWSGIQTVNSISTPLWEYRGSQGFQQAAELELFKGYYFDNQTNLSVLKIPYLLTFTYSQLLQAPDPTLWRIHVHLSQQEYNDQSLSLGVALMANSGLDNLDYRKPRALSIMPSVYFPRPEWGGHYATDIREETEEIQIWEMEVTSGRDESIRLTINGIGSVPTGQEVYLVYEDEKRWVNLRSDSTFIFEPVKQISKFKILVGDKDSINTQLIEILPRDFSLDQNFPNPFNPTTTIPLFLPEDCEIELSVYNLLGQRVKIIYQGNMEVGKHWFHWDGRDDQNKELSAGIYIYSVNTSKGFQYSRKMIFLK